MRQLTEAEVREVSGGVLDKLGFITGIEAGMTVFAMGSAVIGVGYGAYQVGTWLNNTFNLSTHLLNALEGWGIICY
jgi:hypothetical protein